MEPPAGAAKTAAKAAANPEVKPHWWGTLFYVPLLYLAGWLVARPLALVTPSWRPDQVDLAGLVVALILLLASLPRVLPHLRVDNGLKPEFVSRDPDVVKAYKADPLVHDRISARLAVFIAENGPATIAAAHAWTVPTLLLFAGEDKLVAPAGSRAFARAAPPRVVSSQCFDGLYHEIFNESAPLREPVFAALKGWLDARF